MTPSFAAHVPRYTDDDVRGTLAASGEWWRQLTAGLPDPTGALPHALAALDALAGLAAALGTAPPAPPPEGADLTAAIAAMERGAAAAAGGAWDDPTRRAAVDAFLLEAMSRLHAAGRALRTPANGPGTTTGVVVGLHAGGGGVPKPAVHAAEIGIGGLVGDHQRTRRHHGRPWQAVCLWSAEVIDGLAADGHPIFPGAAGENVTVRGIDWALVRAGLLLRIGDALVETSLWALPCRHNAPWFRDGRFDHMHHDRGPVSRVYATVLEPGRVRLGDAAVLEPA